MNVEPFGTAMIEQYLRARSWHFFCDEYGDFLVLITSGARELQVRLCANGSHGDVFAIVVRTAEKFPVSDRGRLLEAVNRWNREKRWPKSFVQETSDATTLRIIGENSFPLMDGVHFELFATLADFTINTAARMFEYIAELLAVPSAETLEGWLRRTS